MCCTEREDEILVATDEFESLIKGEKGTSILMKVLHIHSKLPYFP